jgi:hypothetical protein
VSVTYSALRDADFGPLAAVGEQWLAQAGRLEERESELDDLRRRQIGEAQWTGTVAEEVRSRVKLIGDDTVERAGECRRIAAAIEDAVEVFKDRQEELLELLASLPEGLSVDADGVVTGEAADVAAFESRVEGILEAVGEADETLHAAVAAIAGTADAGRSSSRGCWSRGPSCSRRSTGSPRGSGTPRTGPCSTGSCTGARPRSRTSRTGLPPIRRMRTCGSGSKVCAGPRRT